MGVLLGADPLPLLVSSSTVAAAGTLLNNKTNVVGYRRIGGAIFSSAAAAAGYPRVRQSMDGTNWDIVNVASLDTTQANFLYTIDAAVVAPYVSVEYTDAGAGSTVRAAVYAFIDATSVSTSSSTIVTPTWATNATYVSVFDGLAAPSGQFFELVGTAGVVARIKEIYLFKPSVGITFKGLQQSVASTGGTSASVVTKMDLTNAAASCASKQYTVAPTAGTTAGNIFSASSVTAGDIVAWTFGDDWDQPVVVRATDSFALSCSGAFTAYGYVKWAEASS